MSESSRAEGFKKRNIGFEDGWTLTIQQSEGRKGRICFRVHNVHRTERQKVVATSLFIGLDDTDFKDSIGTGAFSRELMVHLERELGVASSGITRHQFFIHPDIPYTSHNSSACMEVVTDSSIEQLAVVCRRFISFLFHPGADPGLCIAKREQLTERLVGFGRRAQVEVVTMGEAEDLAAQAGILLEQHGGTGQGIIGALGGAALRMSGNDGRFISHRGIRDVEGTMSVRQLHSATAVEKVVDPDGNEVGDDCAVNTNHWIRPDLCDDTVVLRVQPAGEDGCYIVKKKKKGTDDM